MVFNLQLMLEEQLCIKLLCHSPNSNRDQVPAVVINLAVVVGWGEGPKAQPRILSDTYKEWKPKA